MTIRTGSKGIKNHKAKNGKKGHKGRKGRKGKRFGDIYLSFGNMKLPRSITVWSLPAVKTCPNHKECWSYCYALKAQAMYPTCLPCRERNWKASKRAGFIEDMQKAIKGMGNKIVRVHESGDFFNQTYLNRWIAIAKAMPGVRFYAYSKAYKLDFSKLPDNFRVIIDAIVYDYGNITPQDYFLCQGDCTECNYCYDAGSKVVHVAFEKH
jgi:hypothetical protein